MPRKLKNYGAHNCSVSAVYSCCFICGRHESVTRSAPGHIVHCLSFHLEEQVLISLVGPAATEARWFGMIQSPAGWFLWSGWLSCGNAAPAHIVLHLPSWRNHFRELAEAQCRPSALPGPSLPPQGLIWSCQADPFVARRQPHCWDRSWK